MIQEIQSQTGYRKRTTLNNDVNSSLHQPKTPSQTSELNSLTPRNALMNVATPRTGASQLQIPSISYSGRHQRSMQKTTSGMSSFTAYIDQTTKPDSAKSSIYKQVKIEKIEKPTIYELPQIQTRSLLCPKLKPKARVSVNLLRF